MAAWTEAIERLRGWEPERALGLRPAYPRVALELEHRAVALVRLRPRRGKAPLLEVGRVTGVDQALAPATISETDGTTAEELALQFKRVFELCGVRPGRVSLVLPDNLAKLSLLSLPERPPSRRQLEELIRFQTRRGIPFRVGEAALSYQLLPGVGRGVRILVALMRRALVQRYEQALETLGARLGLIDLCTPNLLNLYRSRIDAAAGAGDVALLNCAGTYFSLAIVRQAELVFFRCKSYGVSNGTPGLPAGLLQRELTHSMSYYEEKLGGAGLATLFVRSADTPFAALGRELSGLGDLRVEAIDPSFAVEPGDGAALAPDLAQRLAPALGAALRRS